MQSGPGPWLVARDGPRVVGYAYASAHRSRCAYQWSAETSVYLSTQAQGHGAGTALYRHLLAALPKLGVRVALGGVALPNDASVALHKKLGFTEVGTYRRIGHKMGRYWDVMWLQRHLVDDDTEPTTIQNWLDVDAPALLTSP